MIKLKTNEKFTKVARKKMKKKKSGPNLKKKLLKDKIENKSKTHKRAKNKNYKSKE